MRKRIFLSPPALVCCAGKDRNELYGACLEGRQGGLAIHDMPGCGKFPVGLIDDCLGAGYCREDTSAPSVSKETSFPLAYAGATKIIRIVDAALEQLRPAVEKALSKYSPDRIGICFGSCDNGSENSLMAQNALLEKNAFPEDYRLRYQIPSFPLELISRKFGVSGPAFTVSTACASGASAIVRGAELIRAGFCDAVIVGGADIVSPTVFAGFLALEAVSDSLTNPFSKNRKGLNLGEGAAFFLLDSSAPTQQAETSCIELLGAGESADAHHMTAPDSDGEGAVKAMKSALLDAKLDSAQIGYINLHGTGTELNDKTEALAMKKVFAPPHAPYAALPPVSSTKPIMGHTLGAAGALEAAVCWMVLAEKRGLPVHCWDGVADEEAPFFPVTPAMNGSGFKAPSVCMSNSFAFGGCNVSLILGRVHND